MARFKPYDYTQTKLLPVSFDRQVLPGTFEYTLSHLVDHELDLSVFRERYRNDTTGAPAYDPALLLKVVLYAYARGISSSREMERLCRENVVCMALSADSQPHYTTLAGFISSCPEEVTALFRDVLLICDELGLIGKELFAIDGCKLPCNASKEWSGTRAELLKKQQKMEHAVRFLVARHRQQDAAALEASLREREQRQVATMKRQIGKLKGWLAVHEDKPGKSGKPKKSNVTDNESAKMKSAHGVIQGYDGLAAVDAKHQVVVEAQAFGEAQEHDLLLPMVEGLRENFCVLGRGDVLRQARITADAGFHSEHNCAALSAHGVDGYVADILFRKRDPRFAGADRFKERQRREREQQRRRDGGVFTHRDFHYDPVHRTCVCPAGQKLYRNGAAVVINGYQAVKFRAPKRACRPCPLRTQCLRRPQTSETRQVHFFSASAPRPETFSARMKRKIDSVMGRAIYGRRLATVEPVFGHITHALGLRRFTLRGRRKVDTQWKLFCRVHNLLKIHRYAPGFS